VVLFLRYYDFQVKKVCLFFEKFHGNDSQFLQVYKIYQPADSLYNRKGINIEGEIHDLSYLIINYNYKRNSKHSMILNLK